MKAFLRITFLLFSIGLLTVTGVMAQRVIQGTVYMDGELAAGVTVEAHKGSSMMTSFDGKYKVEASEKSKYLKFTFIDDSQKYDLTPDSPANIDFAFTGELPSGDGADAVGGDVDLRSEKELIKAKDRDYINTSSLYTEFYKQDDYKSALPYWKQIYAKYPKSSANIYIRGAKMYETLIENAATDVEKDKLLDEYMVLLDKRVKHFGQEGKVLGRKGTAWFEYKLHEGRVEQIEGEELTEVLKVGYEWLNSSMDEQGVETEFPIYVLLMNATRALFKLEELQKESVVKNYDKCMGLLNEIISNNEDETSVKNAKEIIPYVEKVFEISGAADCETLVNMLTPQFEEKNDDIEFIKSMLRRLRKAKCDDSELIERATIRLYELEPSAEAAFNMAHSFLKKDDIEKAREYYQQAITQETDPVLLATYHYERGLLRYIKLNDFAGARTEAKKAISLDPNLCEANMLIGDIYVAASRSFDGSNLQKAAIFWVAVDYYNKARILGSDCGIDAATNVTLYKKYFPNKEDAFMEGLQEGQKYKVEGWINETTTVRF